MDLFTTIDKVNPGDIIHVRNDVITILVKEVIYIKESEFNRGPVYRVKGTRFDPYFVNHGESNTRVLILENEIDTTIDVQVLLLKVKQQ